MVRLKGTDNLDDLNGVLATGFNAVTLGTLKAAYVAGAPAAEKVLTDFFLAASQLQTRENEFNRRAKPASVHTLLANLRPADHLAAVRTFNDAKESLLEVNAIVGQQIVNAVERDMASNARRGLKRTFSAT
jgi:hypothetical protein